MPTNDSTRGMGFLEQMLGWMFVNRARLGPLLERMLCCVGSAQDLLGEWGMEKKVDSRQAYGVYAQYAEGMYAFASEFTVHRCAFVSRTDGLYRAYTDFRAKVGSANALDANQLAYVKEQLAAHDDALLDILSECFCAALLPPCPEAPGSNCVPLAVVTLRGNDCQVTDICNWEARKLLITWRTVGYWLSWIPWHCLRDLIAKFCCGDRRGSPVLQWLSFILGMAVVGLRCGKSAQGDTGAAVATGDTSAPGLGGASTAIGVPGHLAIGPQALVTGASAAGDIPAFGDVQAAKDADDLFIHLLSDFDRARSGTVAAPAWYALAARLTNGSLLDQLASVGGPAGIAGMRSEIAQLREMVIAQQARIDALAKT
jgi:hypothetical protein